MIKSALEYIVGLRKPETVLIGGSTYADKELKRISYNPKAEAICFNTLSSLVEYIKQGEEKFNEKMIVHVISPTKVELYSTLDFERSREYIAIINAQVPEFDFNNFINHEKFLIAVQSKFINNIKTDKELILKFAGTVERGTVETYGDDGITQKATVKSGIVSKTDAIVPNIVNLQPYRTFVEVEQPVSSFVFRMKEDKHKYEGVTCGLFEADGGVWKIEAMENIKNYLKKQLEGLKQFIVIS